MEIVCNRCHQTLPAESVYCPACGMPQLVYEADASFQGQEAPNNSWSGQLRDASSVDWKQVLRLAAMLAIPAGILGNLLFLGLLGALLMAAAAAAVVLLSARARRPAWLTMGAGARIGLVTGLIGGWTSMATAALVFYAKRVVLHQGKDFDDLWQGFAAQQFPQQMAAAGWDAQRIAWQKAQMLSPNGQAGWTLGVLAFLSALLVLFSVAGGMIGVRLALRAHPRDF